jgi:hypothetical protein
LCGIYFESVGFKPLPLQNENVNELLTVGLSRLAMVDAIEHYVYNRFRFIKGLCLRARHFNEITATSKLPLD